MFNKKRVITISVGTLLSFASALVFILLEKYAGLNMLENPIFLYRVIIYFLISSGLYNIAISICLLIDPDYFNEKRQEGVGTGFGEESENKENTVTFFHDYSEGLCRVEKFAVFVKKGKMVSESLGFNFIDECGELISEKWYAAASEFENGNAIVYDGGMYNIIDMHGSTVLDEWVPFMGEFNEKGIAKLKNSNDEINFFNRKTCNLVWEKWRKEKI